MSTRVKTNSATAQKDQTVQAAKAVLSGKSKRSKLANLLPFLGPAFIASVAYVDPGNFATNIEGGAQFGLTLLWVIFASNLMAILIQSLSAKLGIATGRNLAEQCHDHFPKWFVYFLWVLMELVAIFTDLAEFLGAALGFNLLLGIPMWVAGILTGITTFLVLGLERKGVRPLEAVISAMVGMVAISYVIEMIIVKPVWGEVAYHAVVPMFSGSHSVVLAAGILGATVMPHAIYLHSALTQGRVVVKKPGLLKKLFKYELVDVFIAMGVASLVNAAMLIMSATTFHNQGILNVGTIEVAYKTLEPLMGKAASWVFGLSLLLSGLSSASVGTMAGQVIMQGFLTWEIPVWVRRLVTMLPSMIVIFVGFDPSKTLVLSQVLLSFGLPFAIIPLVIFTSNKKIMGVLVNRKITTILAWAVAAVVVVLNIYLIVATITGGA
ncbi:MAG: Nramp family divalent metal transporter [Anaerolineaceae bacterium]|nr:Nramp family divalent metal transporter [Anaerolineaceae bacterium]